MNGILNILKPPAMTSFDAVAVVRRALGGARTGHAGTLDPSAAGVLPIFVGKALRILEYAADTDKRYRAEIVFGIETDTLDADGAVTARRPADVSREALAAAAARFLGETLQAPPMHSALRKDGRRLYEIARSGGKADVPPRPVRIDAIDVLECEGDRALIDVRCSKGTYVRALCRDIGEALGCGAHLSFLVRTEACGFRIADAVPVAEIARGMIPPLLPMESVLSGFREIDLAGDALVRFLRGLGVPPDTLSDQREGSAWPGLALARDTEGKLIAVAEMKDGAWKIKAGKLLADIGGACE